MKREIRTKIEAFGLSNPLKPNKKEAPSVSEKASSRSMFLLLSDTDRAQGAHVFYKFHLGFTTLLVDGITFLEEFLP